jgi:NAD(P)-binding Rossmann-like domain
MSPLRAIVVGGSLSGLCAALALAADEAEVVVFERDRELGAGGAGLGVDRSLLGRVIDASPFGDATVPALSVITSNRDSTAWTLIHQWLRNLIDHRPRIGFTTAPRSRRSEPMQAVRPLSHLSDLSRLTS